MMSSNADRFSENFNLTGKIGSGSLGDVHRCVEKATGKEYACKWIPKSKIRTSRQLEDLAREVSILHQLSGNPHVASFRAAYVDDDAIQIVMELCSGGDLFDRIDKCGRYGEKAAAKIISNVVQAIDSIHSSGIMHRDIKPENLVFTNPTEDSCVKVIDFGLSVFLQPGEKLDDFCGTPSYIAPEVYERRYGLEADIWSAGVILFVLLRGYNPFWAETGDATRKIVVNTDVDDLLSQKLPGISGYAKDLIRRMLDRDPSTRITAKEILCHQWLQVHGAIPNHKKVSKKGPFSFPRKTVKVPFRRVFLCGESGEGNEYGFRSSIVIKRKVRTSKQEEDQIRDHPAGIPLASCHVSIKRIKLFA